MKYTPLVKFLIILLTVCSLLVTIVSALGAAVLYVNNLYQSSTLPQREQEYHNQGWFIAKDYANRYFSQTTGNCSEALLQALFGDLPENSKDWSVSISQNGEILYQSAPIENGTFTAEYEPPAWYYKIVHSAAVSESEKYDSPIGATVPTTGSDYQQNQNGFDRKIYLWENGQRVCYWLAQEQDGTCTVSVTMSEKVLEGTTTDFLLKLHPYRYTFLITLGIGLLLSTAGFILLCRVAGHARDGSIRPGGLNRLPLDLYAALVFGLAVGYMNAVYLSSIQNSKTVGFLILTAVGGLMVLLSILGFFFALAAQVKGKTGFWWRKSLIGRCLLLLLRIMKWVIKLLQKLLSVMEVMIRLLPVTWQWLLTALVMGTCLVTTALLSAGSRHGFSFLFFLVLLACIGIVLYGGYAFGLLISGAKKMSQGDLRHHIPTKYLIGCFRDFADQLNALSGAAMQAAQNQMKSERMKSELITNVSHDIKTPLTSIINYVDLLQTSPNEDQRAEYLEVLSRQSQQMKRLIDDLMELSKANTGNIAVQLSKLDLTESVTQALGEYADKLETAGIFPVFRKPDIPVYAEADGRLVWRVLSNLLNNAVKYSMPGTRLYLELSCREDAVLFSMKNISREELHLTAEELMERFVQGDASRNQEGSGLGLNIARSLMEVQHGTLELLLDGDLFKVMLRFPCYR